MQFSFLYLAFVYFAAVFLWRRFATDFPWRIAFFFYLLVLIFLFQPLTQRYVNVPADYLGRLYPWQAISTDRLNRNPEINDVILQMTPWAALVRDSWRSGHVPLWNGSAGGGYPLLANGQSAALSPFRLVALPLPLGESLTCEAALKLLAALSFAWLFARRHFGSRAAIIAAVSFGFSTAIVVWLHFPHASVIALLPALFLALELLTERTTYRRFIFLTLVLTAMIVSGHPESMAHSVVAAGIWELLLLHEARARWRAILPPLLAAGVAALLLASPFLLPFAEALPRSQRYQWLHDADNKMERNGVRSLVPLMNPDFFGTARHQDMWGPAIAEQLCGYSGVSGLIGWLAVLFSWGRRRRVSLLEKYCALLLPLLVVIALGWPPLADLFRHLPLFSLAANGRLRLVVCWLGALLAASFVSNLGARKGESLAAVAIGATIFTLPFFLQKPSDAVHLTEALFTSAPRFVVLAAAAVAALRLLPRRAASLLLLAVITFDLWSFGRDWNPVVEQSQLYPTTPLIRFLQQRTSHDVARIAGTSGALFPNSAALYGLEDIRAHDPMANGHYVGALRAMTGYSSDEYFGLLLSVKSHYLDLLNVRYLVTAPGESPGGRWRLVYRGRDGEVFENGSVLPRFFFPAAIHVEPDQASRLRALMHATDFAAHAFVPSLSTAPSVRKEIAGSSPVRTVRHLRRLDDGFVVDVSASKWSVLASSVPDYPGWRVLRNGEESELLQVNENFVGIVVPPGESHLEVVYRPRSFAVGAALALLTLLLLATLAVGKLRRRAVRFLPERMRFAESFL